MAPQKKYPVFVRFIVHQKDLEKFESVIYTLTDLNGIKDDVFYFSHYRKDSQEEIENVIKINFVTDTTSEMNSDNSSAKFLRAIFASKELKKFFPACVEDPA